MLPPLPKVDVPKMEVPTKFISGKSDDGYYYASANWDDDIPTWRRYKRYGWALRYVNGIRPTKRAADLCQACGAIRVSNMDRCLRCGTSR
jgi:hypothetical protein